MQVAAAQAFGKPEKRSASESAIEIKPRAKLDEYSHVTRRELATAGLAARFGVADTPLRTHGLIASNESV